MGKQVKFIKNFKKKVILILIEGNGNPLQYSCLENPMDGGAWRATVHGVTKSLTRLREFTFIHLGNLWHLDPGWLGQLLRG